LPIFLVVSVGLHAVAFRATRRAEVVDPPAFDPIPQTLAGDTLEVERDQPPADEAEDEPAIAVTDLPVAPAPPASPQPAFQRASTASTPAHAAATASPEPPPKPALFGAVGVRSASDLATTFTRAFPQAASADPVWASAPFGPMGSALVTLTLDDDGHIDRTEIGGSPSPALRRGIERTLVLLGRSRPFTAHGAVTSMRVTARLSRDDVHDGLHGDVFALSGGSFAGDVGNAFFALPPKDGPGRRLDLEVRLLP
jgi:hypothetical protein